MTLKEEIDRIHQITYGKTILKEGVFDKIFGSGTNNVTKTTDPKKADLVSDDVCLLYTSPSPRDGLLSRMPSSA